MPRSLEEIGPFRGYGGEEMPLGSYAVLVGGYLGALGGTLVALDRARAFPRRIRLPDLVLLGAATFQLSRLITKDWVTAPLRAPFARYEESKTAGEVSESARGSGMRRALGDLLTCNYCSGPWIALGLVGSVARWPRPTRLVASVFVVAGISSFLNRAFAWMGEAYDTAEKRSQAMKLQVEQQERALHS